MSQRETVLGSAYWASYLVNNDASGLCDEELAVADAWLERHGLQSAELWFTDEPFFSWNYGLHTGANVRGGDLLEYIIVRRH